MEKEPATRQVAEVEWHWLRPHLQRDAIILVSPTIGVEEAGRRLAADDGATVAAWIREGFLGKPSREQLEEWEAHPERPFRTLIVQPFVLIETDPAPPAGGPDENR